MHVHIACHSRSGVAAISRTLQRHLVAVTHLYWALLKEVHGRRAVAVHYNAAARSVTKILTRGLNRSSSFTITSQPIIIANISDHNKFATMPYKNGTGNYKF